VLATYGFTEAKLAWADVRSRTTSPPGGYHLYPDLGIIEIIDPHSGEVVPAGPAWRTGLHAARRARHGRLALSHRRLSRRRNDLRAVPALRTLRAAARRQHLAQFRGQGTEPRQTSKARSWISTTSNTSSTTTARGRVATRTRKVNDDPHELDELILQREP